MSEYYKQITGEYNPLDLKLWEVWQYKDLIWMFTKRNFVTRYKQTVLGPLWLFITPIISSLTYCFIFGGIAGMSTGGIPQILFYLSGHAIWTFFSSCMTKNSQTFTANAHVFGKVYFPRLTIPISNILTSIIEFAIQSLVVVVFLMYYVFTGMIEPKVEFIWGIPVILIELGMMAMGVGIIISSLTTKYRDLAVLVTFGVQMWMYITPVVYPLEKAGTGLVRNILMINPVTAPVEVYRFVLLGEGQVMPIALIWSAIFTIVVLIGGVMIFNKVEKTFMDTV